MLKSLLDHKYFSTCRTRSGSPRWMLGVLIFEFMTGSAPFEAPYPMQIYAKVLKLGWALSRTSLF